MNDDLRPYDWLVANWPRTVIVAALFLLATTPAYWTAQTRPLLAIGLLLPVYMIHQYEEHRRRGFEQAINEQIGRGLPILTPVSVFWINLLAVELLFVLCLLLARYAGLGFGLVPAWLALVNAVTHIASSVKTRTYNPGLGTAIVLFLPLGLFILTDLSSRIVNAFAFNLLGLLVAMTVHGLIVGFVLLRRTMLEQEP